MPFKHRQHSCQQRFRFIPPALISITNREVKTSYRHLIVIRPVVRLLDVKGPFQQLLLLARLTQGTIRIAQATKRPRHFIVIRPVVRLLDAKGPF
jgi:hypothetical protein